MWWKILKPFLSGMAFALAPLGLILIVLRWIS